MRARVSATAGPEYEIRKMLLFVVECLVDYPEWAEVVLMQDAEVYAVRIYAHAADVAKLMENGGRIASALRCIVGASGRKLGRNLSLSIVPATSRLL